MEATEQVRELKYENDAYGGAQTPAPIDEGTYTFRLALQDGREIKKGESEYGEWAVVPVEGVVVTPGPMEGRRYWPEVTSFFKNGTSTLVHFLRVLGVGKDDLPKGAHAQAEMLEGLLAGEPFVDIKLEWRARIPKGVDKRERTIWKTIKFGQATFPRFEDGTANHEFVYEKTGERVNTIAETVGVFPASF